MFYFFRHSSESLSLSYWCRHNIHIDRDSVQDSLHPHSGWIEKSRVGLEYMLKRRSTYGPSNDEGRRVDRRREKGRDENVLCNFENQRCENLTSTDTTPLCLRAQQAEFLHSHLSVRISTDRKTLGDRTSCWLLSALIFNSLLSSWADGLFIETLH